MDGWIYLCIFWVKVKKSRTKNGCGGRLAAVMVVVCVCIYAARKAPQTIFIIASRSDGIVAAVI